MDPDLKELEWTIRCRRTSGHFDRGWHTIAAFDSETVARHYAADCRAGKVDFEYVVVRIEQ